MSAERVRRRGVAGALLAAALGAALAGGCRSGGKATLDDLLRPTDTEAKFEDIKGDPAEEVIKAFVKLGVLDSSGSHFGPGVAMPVGEFATWLVRANDIMFRDQPSRQIRLASPRELPVFNDVPSSSPRFPYVQGMVNAGYVVAFDRTEFGGDRNLTCEWLILLRDGVDLGRGKVLGDPAAYEDLRTRLRPLLKDADDISNECLAAVLADVTEGSTIRLAFGRSDRLQPRRVVTRKEAVLALSELRGRTWREALTIEPKWEPLPPDQQKKAEEEAPAEGDSHEH
jgi:hypothetical protein